LFGGKPQYCPKHSMQQLTKKHVIDCLNMYRCLFMSETMKDPLSFPMGMLPTRPSIPYDFAFSWSQQWSIICTILHEFDQLRHSQVIPFKHPHGQKLLSWLDRFLQPSH
ncbi:hypothetical protein BCV72DRAFT_321409, partial [Rhizopus microsporus var. microsporus]